jgi:hypothetical protein
MKIGGMAADDVRTIGHRRASPNPAPEEWPRVQLQVLDQGLAGTHHLLAAGTGVHLWNGRVLSLPKETRKHESEKLAWKILGNDAASHNSMLDFNWIKVQFYSLLTFNDEFRGKTATDNYIRTYWMSLATLLLR